VSGGVSLLIHFGTRRRLVTSFTLRPLCPQYPLDMLGGPQKWFGRGGEEEKSLTLPQIETRTSSPKLCLYIDWTTVSCNRSGWCSGNTLDLYSVAVRFDRFFVVFLRLQANAGRVLEIGENRLLSNASTSFSTEEAPSREATSRSGQEIPRLLWNRLKNPPLDPTFRLKPLHFNI